jgi:hypothetical protein
MRRPCCAGRRAGASASAGAACALPDPAGKQDASSGITCCRVLPNPRSHMCVCRCAQRAPWPERARAAACRPKCEHASCARAHGCRVLSAATCAAHNPTRPMAICCAPLLSRRCGPTRAQRARARRSRTRSVRSRCASRCCRKLADRTACSASALAARASSSLVQLARDKLRARPGPPLPDTRVVRRSRDALTWGERRSADAERARMRHAPRQRRKCARLLARRREHGAATRRHDARGAPARRQRMWGGAKLRASSGWVPSSCPELPGRSTRCRALQVGLFRVPALYRIAYESRTGPRREPTAAQSQRRTARRAAWSAPLRRPRRARALRPGGQRQGPSSRRRCGCSPRTDAAAAPGASGDAVYPGAPSRCSGTRHGSRGGACAVCIRSGVAARCVAAACATTRCTPHTQAARC